MTVTTRRERRQQQRRQQQRRATNGNGNGGGSSRKRGVSQLWIALGIAVAVIALVLIGRAAGVFTPATTTNPAANVDASGDKIGTHQDNIGNAHIPTGQKGNYTEGLPPTSGEHYAQPAGPAPWGIKTSWLPFEVTTHNLEHGGIVIMYRDLSQNESEQLQQTVRDLMANGYPKIILEPYPDLQGGKVALTAWDWILKQDGVDQTTIVKFVRQHTDDEAPENGTP